MQDRLKECSGIDLFNCYLGVEPRSQALAQLPVTCSTSPSYVLQATGSWGRAWERGGYLRLFTMVSLRRGVHSNASQQLLRCACVPTVQL